MAVELAPELLEILACPNCHGGLAVDHDRDELVCTQPDCQLAYPVRDGIPVLLIDEARPPQRPEQAAGAEKKAEPAQADESAGDAKPAPAAEAGNGPQPDEAAKAEDPAAADRPAGDE